MKNITAHYRGFVEGLITQQHHAIFATRHKEGQPGSLHRINFSAEIPSLTESALPCGTSALTSDEKNIYIAGDNGKLYQAELLQGAPKAVSKITWNETDPVIALSIVNNNQLAMLHEEHIRIVPLKGNAAEQDFTVTAKASCLAASPDGLWFAVGDSKGHISVYEHQDDTWQLSNQAKVHQGKVTTILFEKNELRFYSAGEDYKLFSTHAQGELQPLDKGRNSNHQGTIQAITFGSERFFTVADDKTVKAWPFAGGQPVTLKERLPKPKYAALVEHLGKSHLMIVGQDQSFTLAGLTPDDKFSELRMRIEDGYAWAREKLADRQASDRDQGIALLARYDDKKSLDLLNKHLKNEQSKETRLAIVNAFEQSKHHYANTLLLDKLSDKGHGEIRLTALTALKKRLDKSDLQTYEKALSTQHIDIGLEALKALAPLAKNDQRAENILIQALQHDQTEIGIHALDLLEKHYEKQSPKASLLALKSQHNSLARAALIRLYQRKLLDQFDVKRTLLLAQNHEDEPLRQTALLVSILGQSSLTKALKTRAKNLAHQLQEIEDFDLLAPAVDDDKNKKSAESKTKDTATHKPSSIKSLSDEDYRVLLQGMSNNHADVSFAAAFAMATLQDQRAFGLLVLLSRERSVRIRAGVCQALAWLNQTESTEQLRILLNDKEAVVRDIAFSALLYISDSSLDVATFGLETNHQDIHDRGLKTLLDCFSSDTKQTPDMPSFASKLKGLSGSKETAKKKPIKYTQTQLLDLLTKALNDPFEPIRQEAFKATLNRKLGGNDQATLQLLLNSHRESIHFGVLNELKASSEVLPVLDWVQPMLFSLLNNDHKDVRQAAFDFIISRKKRFDRQAALAEAVSITHLDVRESAFTYLAKNPSKAHQHHLQVMVSDEHESLRIHALQALITAENEKAVLDALSSEYDDIKVNAAVALASWGNDEAYQPLIDFLQTPKPTEKALREQWETTITAALQGISYLGDSRTYEVVLPFLHHKNSDFVNGAAHALPWITQGASPAIKTQLAELQKDEREIVKANACYALALLGDSQANIVLDHIEESQTLASYQLVAAKAELNNITPISIQNDLENDSTQLSALTMLFAHELLLHSEAPSLTTWALSLDNTEVQLIVAKLLAQYHEPEARWEILREFIIHKHVLSGAKKWTISSENLKQICHVLVHGDGHSKARTMQVLQCIDQRRPFKFWELHFGYWQTQHQSLINELETGNSSNAPDIKQKPIWQQRAFGAYLGLLRQEFGNNSTMRMQALNAMFALAQSAPELVESTQSCLLALLNSQHYDLRHKAFEQLQALEIDTELLGNAATTSPRNDIARQGLMLLTQHYPIKQSKQLLEEMITSDDATLSTEAYQLSSDDQGLLVAAPFALDSQNIALRSRAVNELAAQYDDKKTLAVLVKACTNSEPNVAISAMAHLAEHQHPDAFRQLSQRLNNESNSRHQSLLIRGIKQLKKPQVASFLLDYLLNNPLCQYDTKKLLDIIGSYRHRDTFEALAAHLESDNKYTAAIIKTLKVITGFDQSLEDFEEQTNDRQWIEKAHPFHDDLLLTLFQRLIDLKHHQTAADLWPGIAWMQDKGADQVLADAVAVIQEDRLPLMIQAIHYRLKRREGSSDALLRLLEHKNTDVQFLAAESLALNAHDQGFNILFAAIDYQENDTFRRRAVLALGHLADERSLEKILKLAEDKEHYLQEPAMEAIGHMGDGEDGEKIFKLITRSLDNAYPYGDLAKHAIKGLRYLNTLEAWQYLLRHINDESNLWMTRELALVQLKHWDTDASRDCVLKSLREDDDYDVVQAAYNTARHFWKLDKTIIDEVDVALVQGHFSSLDEDLFERLRKYASAEQLLQLLSADFAGYNVEETLSALAQALQSHENLSDSALIDAIQARKTRVVGIASRLLNRQANLSETLSKVLSERSSDYLALCEKAQQSAQQESHGDLEYLQDTQSCLLELLATQVVHDVYDDTLLGLLGTQDKTQRVFQEKILRGLSAKETISDKSLLRAVALLQQDTLASVRGLADQLMAKHSNVAEDLSWQSFLSQPQILQNGQFTNDLQQAASTQAHQAQVLPTLIQQQDSDTLLKIAGDDNAKENLRVGAIEGLACILTDSASQALSDLHKNTKDTDLAKQAYRALRRQQRQVIKQQAVNQKQELKA